MGAFPILRLTVHPMVLVVTASVSFGVFMGVFAQHEVLFCHLLGLLAVKVFAVLLLLNGVIALVKWGMGRKLGPVIRWCTVILCSCIGGTFVFAELAWNIDQWKDRAVRSYVARALPILDQIKARDGAYPQTLPLSALDEPPEFFRKYAKYNSDGKGFRFIYFNEPVGFLQDDEILTDKRRYWEDPD